MIIPVLGLVANDMSLIGVSIGIVDWGSTSW